MLNAKVIKRLLRDQNYLMLRICTWNLSVFIYHPEMKHFYGSFQYQIRMWILYMLEISQNLGAAVSPMSYLLELHGTKPVGQSKHEVGRARDVHRRQIEVVRITNRPANSSSTYSRLANQERTEHFEKTTQLWLHWEKGGCVVLGISCTNLRWINCVFLSSSKTHWSFVLHLLQRFYLNSCKFSKPFFLIR